MGQKDKVCVESLQDCFKATDWNLLLTLRLVSELAECVPDYNNFCKDLAVKKKTFRVYHNNKPWITKIIQQTSIYNNF